MPSLISNIFKNIQLKQEYSTQIDIELPVLNEHLNINWGRGRLRSYQSLESFYAEFCLLNSLTVKDCLNFWRKTLDLKKADYISHPKQISRLAEILHEEESIVTTVFVKKDFIRNFFGQSWNLVSWAQTGDYKEIKYCPKCINDGYHAYFHDYHVFKKCLIHNIELVEEKFYSRKQSSRYYLYVNYLRNLMLKNSNGKIFTRKIPVSEQFLKSRQKFEVFINWTKEVDCCTRSMIPVNPIDYPYSNKSLQELFGKLQFIQSSEQILDLCKEDLNICRKEAIVIRFGKHLLEELSAITKLYSYKEFLQFYLLACINDNKSHAFIELAQQKIKSIKNKHMHCDCYVGWTKSSGWLRFEKPVNGHLKFLCPFHYICMLIEDNWLNFNKMNHFFTYDSQFNSNYHYIKGIELLTATNWITKNNEKNQDGKSELIFNWSPQLTFFLEVIAYSVLDVCIESYETWLSAYSVNRELNVNVIFLQHNAYLYQLEDTEDVELIVWKAGKV